VVTASQVKVSQGFRSGSKAPGGKSVGRQGFVTQVWGKVAQRPGLYEFADDFRTSFAQRIRPLCAAGRARMGVPGQQREGNDRPKPHECRMRSRNVGLRQGAIPHSGTWLRGESGNCANRRRYPRAVASRMRRTSVRWLATKSPCRTVTWQEDSLCTGIRLSPNRSRTLLRLSAELRRP
jgi:hypothetical protein